MAYDRYHSRISNNGNTVNGEWIRLEGEEKWSKVYRMR